MSKLFDNYKQRAYSRGMETTHISALQATGLTRDQAAVYETLVKNGPLPAREAAHKAGLGRTLGYAVLEQLIAEGLVTKESEKTAVALFSAAHPSVLSSRVILQQKVLEQAGATIEGILPELSSLYNLATGKPGVQFFEGLAGIKKVLEDTLTAKEVIYTYADLEMIEKHIGDINREYSRKREKLGILKKGLLLDTKEARFLLEGYHTKVTNTKLIPASTAPFKTVMQIYDGKISYFTLGVDQLIGVIITDPHIYLMHKTIFERLWEMTPEVEGLS